ncbi:hypothetical protein V5799_011160 [Amblyomma americanum]|uniref:Uncharacterized protein n=1 Tax=Amblyomma americanum TaxID=6943 RepID=A0AAQ4EI35_AMBAM
MLLQTMRYSWLRIHTYRDVITRQESWTLVGFTSAKLPGAGTKPRSHASVDMKGPLSRMATTCYVTDHLMLKHWNPLKRQAIKPVLFSLAALRVNSIAKTHPGSLPCIVEQLEVDAGEA